MNFVKIGRDVVNIDLKGGMPPQTMPAVMSVC